MDHGNGRARLSVRRFEQARAEPSTMQTHTSTVVFDGDFVHKRKQAVRYPFVDLGTAQRRGAICEREVALNRRFAPDVYLGVEDIVDDAGNVIDYAVLMRRMPAERRLSTLVRTGPDPMTCLRAVARALAAAHSTAPRSDEILSVATPDALRALWDASLRQIELFEPDVVDPDAVRGIEALAIRFLGGRTALLEERIARGQIVDGHGDLLSDDIFCLDDGPRILDCLEFDDGLRWGDVLNDVGFLAMDLEHLDRPDLAARLLGWYGEYSAETHPPSLLHHYVAYRALVRAKVSCLRRASEDARAYLAQCWRHLRAARVQLVLVGGLPGTGKSTLAAGLGDELGWPVLRTDEVRRELADPVTGTPAGHRYGEGAYAPAMKDRTYDAALARARHLLEHGVSVIVDASFARERWRGAFRQLATDTSSDLTELRCVVSSEIAAERIAGRAQTGDASEATPTIATLMAGDFDPWPTAVFVDTLRPISEVRALAVARLGVPAAFEPIGRDGALPGTPGSRTAGLIAGM